MKSIHIFAGPSLGFLAVQANLFIGGSLRHFYSETIPYNESDIEDICKKFSAAYGYPSHANPEAPGQILEGGEDVCKPRWPVNLLRTAKGCTGTSEFGGKKRAGNYSSHHGHRYARFRDLMKVQIQGLLAATA